jgi:hypothetical protein
MGKKQECKNDHFLQNITRRVVLKLESEFQNYGFEFEGFMRLIGETLDTGSVTHFLSAVSP